MGLIFRTGDNGALAWCSFGHVEPDSIHDNVEALGGQWGALYPDKG